MPLISAVAVNDTMRRCLFEDAELVNKAAPPDAVMVDGIMFKCAFHPQRLEAERSIVAAWLRALHPNFHAAVNASGEGGGWSFLNLCDDKNGEQWTGLHQTMHELVLLAIGLGLGRFLMPREMWSMFPGGMPYVVFNVPEAP